MPEAGESPKKSLLEMTTEEVREVMRGHRPRGTLWYAGLGLVLLKNTGIWWTNQVGGHMCSHPEVEGVYIPLTSDMTEDNWAPCRTLELRLTEITENYAHGDFTLEMADAIDAALANIEATEGLRVDRVNLDECSEAWVFVDVLQDAEGYHEGFAPCKGVLTWQNSD